MGANGATGGVSAVGLPPAERGETLSAYVDRVLASVEGVDVRPYERLTLAAAIAAEPVRVVMVSPPGAESWLYERVRP